jgi:hypothetical protein
VNTRSEASPSACTQIPTLPALTSSRAGFSVLAHCSRAIGAGYELREKHGTISSLQLEHIQMFPDESLDTRGTWPNTSSEPQTGVRFGPLLFIAANVKPGWTRRKFQWSQREKLWNAYARETVGS